jgi:hypothetical protein
MTRSIVIVLVAAGLAAAALTVRLAADGSASGAAAATRPPEDPRLAGLLRSGEARYRAYVSAELASLRDRRAARDAAGARVHARRLAPAVAAGRGRPSAEPLAVSRAAARVLSVDARSAGSAPLLDVEAHVAGAGVAFDGIRDALWSQDQGFVGSIDERLATVRAELEPHRRGSGFVPPSRLTLSERRRLAAALDALAWRLDLASRELSRALAPGRPRR